MKTHSALLIIFEMAALFVSGCGESPEKILMKAYSPQPYKDVTTSSQFNFASFSGTVCISKVKLALAEVKTYTGAYNLCLVAPIHFDSQDPTYTPGAEMRVKSVLPPGTHLRIGRLMKDQGVGGVVMVEAILLDGANVQKTVYLDDILLAGNKWGRGELSDTNWSVNPSFLEATVGSSSALVPGNK